MTESIQRLVGTIRLQADIAERFPLPAVRIKFHAVGASADPEYVGETTTSPDGQFDFDFSTRRNGTMLRARFLQFVDETWTELPYEPEDVTIEGATTTHNYLVPSKDVLARPTRTLPSPAGADFLFGQVGLIPLDRDHIRNGEATYQEGNFRVTQQPLGGTLRITGRFADLLGVSDYRLEVARVDESGALSPWRPVLDPLTNLTWNPTELRWVQRCLGPNPKGLYQNVDHGPGLWTEPYLKVCWKSNAIPDGVCVLRITGYDADGNTVAQETTPPLRLSNSAPKVTLAAEVGGGPIGNCGAMTLGPQRTIRFRVSVSHPQGDVRDPVLTGTRGPKGEAAGKLLTTLNLPPSSPNWPGWKEYPVDFAVEKTTCGAMAYSFTFGVKRAATDGRSIYLASTTTTASLLVSETGQ